MYWDRSIDDDDYELDEVDEIPTSPKRKPSESAAYKAVEEFWRSDMRVAKVSCPDEDQARVKTTRLSNYARRYFPGVIVRKRGNDIYLGRREDE